LTRVVRDQIGHGADWVKLYGDYRWGPRPGAHPTFSLDEMKLTVKPARSAGVPVAVDATSGEGMRRAILAGAETVEHGDEGTPEIFDLMAKHHVAYFPTLAATEATSQYAGWRKANCRSRKASSGNAPASRPRSGPGSRFLTAAMSAYSGTATMCANSG
jgi:imidazolonepropionase-like amidohydrolase